jgi:hypothetical protein
MKRLSIAVVMIAALAASAPRAQAQAGAEAEVRATVQRLFDGMRAGDSAAVRSVFHSTARMQRPAMNREGVPVVQSQPVDGFVQAVGTPHDQVWDERISNLVVQVDGNLAQVWMNFTFYLGGQKRHCGVNAAQLARTPEGWKFIQLADTARMTDCPDLPPG